jgi:hypothetical protein
MPKYEPINVGVQFDTLLSGIHSIDWAPLASTLEFYIPESDNVLKIAVNGMAVIRVLDEFHVSTEDIPEDRHGMVPCHFAYEVSGHVLKDVQSVYLRENGTHYQFITGSGCADVISEQPPSFTVRPLTPLELAELEDEDEDEH